MKSDVSPKADSPAVGVPLWLVADTLGITTRQVRRLEDQGVIASWHEGAARVYGLDQVRRLARRRLEDSQRDTRMSKPSEAALRVLEHGMAPDLCRALVRQRAVSLERAFWSYVTSVASSERGATEEEFALVGELASIALRAKHGRGGAK